MVARARLTRAAVAHHSDGCDPRDRGAAGSARRQCPAVARAGAGARTAGADPALVLDLDGFPRTWPVPVSRWFVWFGVLTAAVGAVRLIPGALGAVDRMAVGLGATQLALGVVAIVFTRRARVLLQPDGYRVGDPLLRGRLRPWSGVVEIRPAGRWTKHAEIRGTTAADAPVALTDMSIEQAQDLQRRLGEARARAGSRERR